MLIQAWARPILPTALASVSAMWLPVSGEEVHMFDFMQELATDQANWHSLIPWTRATLWMLHARAEYIPEAR